MGSILKMEHICKNFAGLKALDDISLDIQDDEIFGPVSVSYTHLDVYKRQAQDCSQDCVLFRPVSLLALIPSQVPV